MNALAILKDLIRFPSITPDEAGSFDYIQNLLHDFHAVRIDVEGVKNLYLYKDFLPSGEGTHLSFAGHLDVVPPGEGWASDPFEAVEKEGWLYGRGTQDMKSGVAAFLAAVASQDAFPGRISLILTSDEEGDAKYGTIEVLKYLKEKNELPACCVVAEPTCDKRFGDMVKVGRRGSINGVIEIKGRQGHAAYPEKSVNPVHQIAPVLSKIAGIDLDAGDEFFAPSKLVITDIRGGIEVTNVTPGKLKIMFNVRNSTKTTKEDVERYVSEQLRGLDFTLTLAQSAKPFRTNADSSVVRNMAEAIAAVTGSETTLGTAGGTSDARFLGEYGVETVEFGVVNDTIHAPNERTEVAQVEMLEKVFKEFLRRF